MRRILVILSAVLMLWAAAFAVCAEEQQAQEISGAGLVTDSQGFPSTRSLFDGYRDFGADTAETASLTLSHSSGIGSLYLTFERSYGPYTVINNDTGAQATVGTYGYVHEFIDLTELFGTAPTSITLCFESGSAALYEMDVYSPGQVPDSVQKWSEPVDGKTDLILFSTHSDDEQLFFAGLLPYYAVERGYQVQVVYLTSHWNMDPYRIHEALDGLWGVGIRTYPVFGPYPDFSGGSTLEYGFDKFQREGYSREQMTGFVVELLRRFKPLVTVGHDFAGEYGHIQHMVYARLLADALELSGDPAAYPETAGQYGLWDVPKAYFHLYEENKIVMDWDQPMENFGGMTPYEVTKHQGFVHHPSQAPVWGRFFNPAAAADITWYSPCHYGLYRSTVGGDVQKNDFFENLTCHAELDRLAAEEAARLAAEEEAARLAAEEEAARRAEEQARLEADARRQQEEEERARQEAAALQEQSPQPERSPAPWVLTGTVILAAAAAGYLLAKRKFRNS